MFLRLARAARPSQALSPFVRAAIKGISTSGLWVFKNIIIEAFLSNDTTRELVNQHDGYRPILQNLLQNVPIIQAVTNLTCQKARSLA